MPVPATTKILPHPQQIDVEPIPICCAYQTAYGFANRCEKEETEGLLVVVPGLLFVEAPNALPYYRHCGVFGLLNVGDSVFLIHMVPLNSLPRRLGPPRLAQSHPGW